MRLQVLALLILSTSPQTGSFVVPAIQLSKSFPLSFSRDIVGAGSSFVSQSVGHGSKCHTYDSSSVDCARSLSMEVDTGAPVNRRDLVRGLGGALASLAAASAVAAGRAEPVAAAVAVRAPSVPRRPASKRSPSFLCDDAVSYLYNPDKQSEMWLVGTAHISNASAQLVENVIRDIKPQVVMVELDAQRLGSFLEDSKEPDTSPEGIAQAKKAAKEKKRTPFFGSFFKQLLDPNVSISDRVTEFFAAALGKAISKMYESMDQKGMSSGQEFTVAIREARRCGAKLLLGDRDVQATLRRLSQALRSTNLEEVSRKSEEQLGLGLEALQVGGSAESINENLERLKRRETMGKVIDFYKREAPELYSAMIGERDKIMAVNLMTLEGQKNTVVAVVGLAHVDGIEAILAANGWKRQRC